MDVLFGLVPEFTLGQVSESVDVLLIDIGAGISTNVTFYAFSAQDSIIVVSLKMMSLPNAFALINFLVSQYREHRFKVLVNMTKSSWEAMEVFRKLDMVADRFLHGVIEYVGYIPMDDLCSACGQAAESILGYIFGLAGCESNQPACSAIHAVACDSVPQKFGAASVQRLIHAKSAV